MSISYLSKLIALVAGMLALLLGDFAVSADIVLRQKVTPVKPVVSLGDIADIQNTTVAERQRLALTPLWVAPPVGEQRFVTAQQVLDVLVNRGYRANDLNMYGAPRVAIGWEQPQDQPPVENTAATDQPQTVASNSMGFRVPAAASLASDRPTVKRNPIFLSDVKRDQIDEVVREAVLVYLEDQSGKLGQVEVEVSLPRRHADLLSLRTGELTVSGGKSPWFGRQMLRLECDSERGPLSLTIYVDAFDTTPVLVAKRPIARGQLITAADVSIETPGRDARVPAGRQTIYSLEEALGKESSRAIREGEIVTTDLCLAPLMLERNQVAQLISAGGGIVIRRQVLAVGEARLGDVTEVKLLDSNERLVARVTGPGELATLGSASFTPSTTHRTTPGYR